MRLGLLPLIALLLSAFPAASGARAEEPQEASSPNIVVILADDLGYGDLSSYGAEDLESPNIDKLVEAGMRFENAYANCPVCSPTRAALLSGRYPELAGVPGVVRTHPENNWGYLRQDITLLPAVLSEAGYHTAAIGKWHLGLRPENHPTERGFDLFHGFLGDMMDDYFTHLRWDNNYMRRNKEQIDPEGHATDLFTDWSIDYIKKRARTDQPFFLYLAYNAPHGPLQPPKDWLEKVKQREAGISDRRAQLVALIEHMDSGIGKVIDALRRTGEYENTLIVFTSDNGGIGVADNGPWRGRKGQMYEGGIRVPMAVVWPGHVKPGSSTGRIAMSMDILPTAMEAAGVEIEQDIDGRSFLPTLLGEDQPAPERDLFWVRREGRNRFMGQAIWAARRGPWKLLQNTAHTPFELYNLAEDPKEQHNLADENREKFNEMAHLLRNHMHRGGAVPWQKAAE